MSSNYVPSTRISPFNEAEHGNFEIQFRLITRQCNQDSIKDYAKQVSDEKNINFGNYMKSDEITSSPMVNKCIF